ncbi:MAG: hypothetical protein PHS27_02765 [Candidatus Pacebacteria bacterium]|nr:hypothetical protein [Candidatus Paceibacterota bacterium]
MQIVINQKIIDPAIKMAFALLESCKFFPRKNVNKPEIIIIERITIACHILPTVGPGPRTAEMVAMTPFIIIAGKNIKHVDQIKIALSFSVGNLDFLSF